MLMLDTANVANPALFMTSSLKLIGPFDSSPLVGANTSSYEYLMTTLTDPFVLAMPTDGADSQLDDANSQFTALAADGVGTD